LSVASQVFFAAQLGEGALCAVCTDLKGFGLLSPLKTEINVLCLCACICVCVCVCIP